MINSGDGINEIRTRFLFPLRRCLTLTLLFISLLLIIFGCLTSPVDELYYYVLYWTFAAFFLFVSILVGSYDIVKTYMETRFSWDESNRNNFRTDVLDIEKSSEDKKKMGS
ncbi:MAG: hypothetical protein LBP87_04860 [Planctomycetaceae bacterium]|jgi:hypothetical protein|nr:hypothetical protein [Planctomycetaceae bacterium]